MFLKGRFICLLIGLISVATTPVHAQDSYELALDAVAKGRSQSALQLLEKTIETQPDHAGAWLDLGILYCELGHKNKAFHVFDDMQARFNLPTSIQDVIAHYRESGCQVLPQWAGIQLQSLQTHVGLGHVSNANLGPLNALVRFAPGAPIAEMELAPSAKARPSHAYEQGLTATGDIGNRFQWQAQLQARQFAAVSSLNTITAQLQVAYQPTDDPWRLQAFWGRQTLGGDTFLNQYGVGLKWPISDGQQALQWTWLRNHLPVNSLYNSQVHELSYVLTVPWFKWQGRAWVYQLGLIHDAPQQVRPGGVRAGGVMKLATPAAVWAPWNLIAKSELLYMHTKEQDAYNVLFFDNAKRQQSYLEWGVELLRPITRDLSVYVNGTYQKNTSSIDIFSYKNQKLMIGLKWIL